MNQSTSHQAYSALQLVEMIFAHMAATYGNRFNDLWRGINPDDVKAVWAGKLSEFDPFDIKHALNKLIDIDRPPNLPEFYSMCREGRAIRVNQVTKLPSNEHPETRTYTQEDVRKKLAPFMKKIIVDNQD